MGARASSTAFDIVRSVGTVLPDVDATTRYDGAPTLTLRGCFLAGLATHPSAEPDSLVVRMEPDERDLLLADAPETYYVTDHYRPYPVVLARLARLDRVALKDLLTVSWRLTLPKSRRRRRPRRAG